MRLVQILVFFTLLGLLGLFAVQNTDAATVRFLRWTAGVPVALLIVVVYLLGMISGGTVVAILKGSYRGIVQGPKS